MCVRLYTNIFGTLLPFYLIDVVQMGTDDQNVVSYNLALVPMLAYASSVIVSTQLDKFYLYFGRKKALFVGTAICIICLTAMAFIDKDTNWLMYILPFFIGKIQFIQALHNLWFCQLESISFLMLQAQKELQELSFSAFTVYWINSHREQPSFQQVMRKLTLNNPRTSLRMIDLLFG